MSARRLLPLLLVAASLPLGSCAICIDTSRNVGLSPIADTLESTTGSIKAVAEAAPKAIENISAKDEVAVGQATAIQMYAGYGGLVNDEVLTDYVNDVGNLVSRFSRRVAADGKEGDPPRMKSRRFFFAVLDDDSMNAFSVPGGFVFITRGLLQNLTSESDLAFVLAHEVAHVDKEHNLKTLKIEVGGKAAVNQVIKELGVAGKTADGKPAGLDFDNPKFFSFIVRKLAELKKKANPEQEREADREGLKMIIAAGYDPHAAERVIDIVGTAGPVAGYDPPEQRKAALADFIANKTGNSAPRRFDERAAARVEAVTLAKAKTAASSNTPAPAP